MEAREGGRYDKISRNTLREVPTDHKLLALWEAYVGRPMYE